ncbi:uncharacterized protein LOC106670738 [Cimex lectularius]|uniref:Uncharacterized protein n=1 Tax=Cimex lectularius TaxID=79782 RepID=A0A8I6S4R4_CIMLE|nr:uncharacterized protein LOC106670738 [Cimex lectularius]
MKLIISLLTDKEIRRYCFFKLLFRKQLSSHHQSVQKENMEKNPDYDKLLGELAKFLDTLEGSDWSEFTEMEEALSELKGQLALFRDHLVTNGDLEKASVEDTLRDLILSEMAEMTSLMVKLSTNQQTLEPLKTKNQKK